LTTTSIRQLTPEEAVDINHRLDSYAFAASPPVPDVAVYRENMAQRIGAFYFGLFEDDHAAAVVGCNTLVQNIRGRLYDMGGVFGVITDVAARRKGYSRRLLAYTLAQFRGKGMAFSCLYPFRESFYERLGYATFPQYRSVKFSTAVLTPLLERDFGGHVERRIIGEGYDEYRAFLRKIQPSHHGLAFFRDEQKESAGRNRLWIALALVDGEVAGVLLYALQGSELMNFTLKAYRLYYASSAGKYLLLQWIARHVDQASQVEVWMPPGETPETWFSDMAVKTETAWIPPMGRVVDMAGIGGMSAGAGSFTAAVSDPVSAWNNGTWRF